MTYTTLDARTMTWEAIDAVADELAQLPVATLKTMGEVSHKRTKGEMVKALVNALRERKYSSERTERFLSGR